MIALVVWAVVITFCFAYDWVWRCTDERHSWHD